MIWKARQPNKWYVCNVNGYTLSAEYFQVGMRDGWLASVSLPDGVTWRCDKEHIHLHNAQATAEKTVASFTEKEVEILALNVNDKRADSTEPKTN